MFLEVNNLRYNQYISFIKDMLKKNDIIIFSCIEPFDFDISDKVENFVVTDWQDINITNYESIVGFNINYYQILQFFEKFNSYSEVFCTTGIYRIMFANNGVIKCVCMTDEILIY